MRGERRVGSGGGEGRGRVRRRRRREEEKERVGEEGGEEGRMRGEGVRGCGTKQMRENEKGRERGINHTHKTFSIRRCDLHGIGWHMHVLSIFSTWEAKGNPLLVAGKLDKLAKLILIDGGTRVEVLSVPVRIYTEHYKTLDGMTCEGETIILSVS